MQAPWQLHAHRAQLSLGPLLALVDLSDPQAGLTQIRLVKPAGAAKGHAGALAASHVLGVGLPAVAQSELSQEVEAYLRGPDLIATYRGAAAQPFRWQVYWRAERKLYPGSLAAIELVVSVQTRLLDSQPQLMISSLLPAVSGWRWRSCETGREASENVVYSPAARREFDSHGGLGCYRFPLADAEIDYVEIVHPADFTSSSLAAIPPADPGPAPCSAPQSARMAGQMLLAHQLFVRPLEKGVILRSRVLGLFVPREAPQGNVAEYYRVFAAEAPPLTT
jgi:hypothetical protein